MAVISIASAKGGCGKTTSAILIGAEFALKHRLPSMYPLPEFVQVGGLSSYGPDRADLFRRAATYVDKILKGVNPADLSSARRRPSSPWRF